MRVEINEWLNNVIEQVMVLACGASRSRMRCTAKRKAQIVRVSSELEVENPNDTGPETRKRLRCSVKDKSITAMKVRRWSEMGLQRKRAKREPMEKS